MLISALYRAGMRHAQDAPVIVIDGASALHEREIEGGLHGELEVKLFLILTSMGSLCRMLGGKKGGRF